MKARIIVGITGSIAAYKSIFLIRLLCQLGHEVRVILTASAEQFVTPLSLQAISGNTVRQHLFDEQAEVGMSHIELARWADMILIAPASAGFIGRLAAGLSNDLLTTVCLATKTPVLLAPAMNQQMWQHALLQRNIQILQDYGYTVIDVERGMQACGDEGLGRMQSPEEIVKIVTEQLARQEEVANLLRGKTLLITAGPTLEDIDPVRFISNRSSGKMGYAIAQAACDMGAKVILISGPVTLTAPQAVTFFPIRSAMEMYQVVQEQVLNADIFIACAAVADYRVSKPLASKIKKQENKDKLILELKKNPDILAEIAKMPTSPLCVGFAAETDNLKENVAKKLTQKGVSMIAGNWVGKAASGQGFDSDQNALLLCWKKADTIMWKALQKTSKKILAVQLLKHISRLLEDR